MPYARRYKSVGFASKGRRIRGEVSYGKANRSAILARKRANRAGYGSVARTRGAAATGEMKYFDTEQQGTTLAACTTTWVAGTLVNPTTTIDLGDAAVATPACLFAPKVSAALNGRIGRQVCMKKVKMRGFVNVAPQNAQSAADSPTEIRMMLVMDMQTNAAPMTAAQLMRDAGVAGTTLNSFQNPNNFGRFKVLREKILKIDDLNLANDTGATGGIVQAGRNIPWKMGYNFGKAGVIVKFNSTNGGTVADIIDNSLHYIIAVNSTAYSPTVQYYARVSYKE